MANREAESAEDENSSIHWGWVTSHEGEFAAQEVGDFVAVKMGVQVGNGVGRRNFPEHRHALGNVTRDLEGG